MKKTVKKLPGKIVRNKSQTDTAAVAPFTLFTAEPTTREPGSANGELSPEHIIAKIRQLRYFQVHTLVELLVGLINELERRETEDLWRALSVARKRVTWPVLAGRHTAIQKKNAERFERIQLGRDIRPIINLVEVPINPTPARRCILALIEIVEQVRFRASASELIYNFNPDEMTAEHFQRLRGPQPIEFTQILFSKVVVNWSLVFKIGKLPDLVNSPENISQWQEAALELLELSSDEDPSSISELCALGEHRRFQPLTKKEIAELELVPGVDDPDFPLEKQKKRINAEIRSILRGEIKKLARDLGRIRPTES